MIEKHAKNNQVHQPGMPALPHPQHVYLLPRSSTLLTNSLSELYQVNYLF